VVSTYPLATQALGRLKLAGLLHAGTVSVMTDPSIHPLCVASGIDLHLAQNDEATAVIWNGYGLPAVTYGPLVSPAFRPRRGVADMLAARQTHGLPLDDRLVLVAAGSFGVSVTSMRR
jgi:hypothetical protein